MPFPVANLVSRYNIPDDDADLLLLAEAWFTVQHRRAGDVARAKKYLDKPGNRAKRGEALRLSRQAARAKKKVAPENNNVDIDINKAQGAPAE